MCLVLFVLHLFLSCTGAYFSLFGLLRTADFRPVVMGFAVGDLMMTAVAVGVLAAMLRQGQRLAEGFRRIRNALQEVKCNYTVSAPPQGVF